MTVIMMTMTVDVYSKLENKDYCYPTDTTHAAEISKRVLPLHKTINSKILYKQITWMNSYGT